MIWEYQMKNALYLQVKKDRVFLISLILKTNLYWISFYMENFFTRAEDILSAIYHILNVKFNINEPSKMALENQF